MRHFISQSDNRKDNKSDKVDTLVEHVPAELKKVQAVSKQAENNTINAINKKIDSKSKHFEDGIYQRPSYWQPDKNENDATTLRVSDTFASADARVNIVMVLMFSLSMIATMLLANILSQF